MRMTEADKAARRKVIASVLAEAVERRRTELVEAVGHSGRQPGADAGGEVAPASEHRSSGLPAR